MTLTPHKFKKEEYNENWEFEIAAYDNECRRNDEEFRKHALVLRDLGTDVLTEEEKEVLTLYLNGVSCREIAKQCQVEPDIVSGLLDVISAKLSLNE